MQRSLADALPGAPKSPQAQYGRPSLPVPPQLHGKLQSGECVRCNRGRSRARRLEAAHRRANPVGTSCLLQSVSSNLTTSAALLLTQRRFMIDSNIFDELVADETLRRKVVSLARQCRVELVTTHLQEDELRAVASRDATKYRRIQSLPRTVVLTSDFIVGVSRLGMARIGDGTTYEAIRRDKRHIFDAEIAATAKYEQIPLITSERRLRNQAAAQSVPVVRGAEFVAHIRTL